MTDESNPSASVDPSATKSSTAAVLFHEPATNLKRSLEVDEEAMNDEPPQKKVQEKQTVQAMENMAPSTVISPPVMTQEEEELALMQDETIPATSSSAGPSRMQKSKNTRKYLGKDTNRNAQDQANGTYKQEARKGRNPDDENKEKKLPKRRVALMLGFSGQGYSGMQIQTDPSQAHAKTIEATLFKALCDVGAISKDNSDNHKKVDLARAARTDAGVSAAGNVVSLKMITEVPGTTSPEELTAKINELLPSDIRMWGYQRVLGSFNARTAAESRVYEYLLPTYVLIPPRPGSQLGKRLQAYRNSLQPEGSATEEDVHPHWQTEPEGEKTEEMEVDGDIETAAENASTSTKDRKDRLKKEEIMRKRTWRISTEETERFRSIMKGYLGTHNFHNFTLFKPFNDRTVKRYMIDIDVAEPKVYGDIEWISVKIHGQSFMLHQIRKMISLAILMARTNSPIVLLEKTFGPTDIHIPKAPALGLLLEQPRFGSYNNRLLKTAKVNQMDLHQPLSFERYRTEIDAFKVRHIYERLREEEEKMNTFAGWVSAIDGADTDEFGYLNVGGVIPTSAVKQSKGRGNRSTLKMAESDDDEAKAKAAAED